MIFKMKTLAALSVCFLIGCGSKQVVPEGSFQQARWDTKVRVKDLKKEKTQSFSAIVSGQKDGMLRMDATAVMGIPVATYVMNQDGFKCAIFNQKKFYEGPLKDEALRPLLKFDLSPTLLHRIAFDQQPNDRDWKCDKNEEGLVEKCESASRGLQVEWKRKGGDRDVRVTGPGFEMDWLFGAAQTDVQFRPETFQLEPPANFNVIRL